MTDTTEITRHKVLQRFETFAARLFDRHPDVRAVVFSVAQYWNDQADDEVHGFITLSQRDQPVWPHECGEARDEPSDTGDGPPTRPVVRGETCDACHGGDDRFSFGFRGGNGDGMVQAFEAFCLEVAHQDMEPGEGYLPFAIARRVGRGVEVEQVGQPQRQPAVIGSAATPTEVWDDPQVQELLREIGGALDDDGPRVVLADYLLEAYPGEPIGEALALCLAPALDDAGRARRDALLADNRERWLHPLGRVTARGGVVFDRGLPRALEVYADAFAQTRVGGSPTWATIETVRLAPGSKDFIDAEMIALRDIGALGFDGVHAIALARRPWAIERLFVRESIYRYDGMIETVIAATTLPRLRELAIAQPAAALPSGRLAAATWYPDLERLTLVVPALDTVPLAELWQTRPLGKQLAIVGPGPSGHPAGWQIVFDDHHRDRAEISQVGWSPNATVAQLAKLVAGLPSELAVELVGSRHRSWRPDDIALLRTDRAVRIAP